MLSLTIFSLLLAVSIVSALNVPESGNNTLQQQLFLPGMIKKETGFHPRIINGQIAEPDQFPHQVAVIPMVGSIGWLCAGALISNQWVITARRCTYRFHKIKVQLGMVNLQHPKVEYEVNKSSVFYYLAYNEPPSNIALIKIQFVTFTNFINSINLPKKVQHYRGNTAIASGWGYTSNGGHNSPSLKYVTLEVISNEECAKHYGGNNVTPETICTGHSYKGICISDTGGPLIIENPMILIGIAAFGPKEGCGKGLPDGFTRVDYYLHWIKNIMILNE